MRHLRSLTGVERTFEPDDIIVSKTDRRGIITYANRVFVRVSQYSEQELLGSPHNLIRHPDMPRCVFRLLWETIEQGREIFAYVVNRAKSGDHYWVFAHVTPTFGAGGDIIGYHSSRRVAYPAAVEQVRKIYARLMQEEQRHETSAAACDASTRMLVRFLEERGMTYEQFIFSLARPARPTAWAAPLRPVPGVTA
ncbi:MAG: PAS domain-containing protein [Pirellulaceae bacterium]